jgi:dolichol-phosphate mannosyltransferase
MFDLTVLLDASHCDTGIENVVYAIESEFKHENINGEIILKINLLKDKTCEKSGDLNINSKNLTILDLSDAKEFATLLSYGYRFAKSDYLIFYDARYSLKPAIIPALFHELQSGNDLVIGKRNYRDIKDNRFTKNRYYSSIIKNNFARFLFPAINDPTSDIFAIKKDQVTDRSSLKPNNKILPEILGRENWNEVKEISLDPYETAEHIPVSERFFDIQYFFQLLSILLFSLQHRDLAGWKEIRTVIKFGIVGITGIFINMGFLFLFSEIFHIFYLISGFLAIELSIINNFIWNDIWTFGKEKNQAHSLVTHRFFSYHIVSIGGMLINIGVLVIFTEIAGFYYLISNLLGIFIAFSWNFLVNRMTTWRIRPL